MKSTIVYIAGTAPSSELVKALGYRNELVAFRNATYFNASDLEEFEKGAKATVVLDEPLNAEGKPTKLANAAAIAEAYGEAKVKVKVLGLSAYLKAKPEAEAEAEFNPDAPVKK